MKIHVVKSERHQRRKRVAAYCRVSTMDCSQEESYETQKEYYEKMNGTLLGSMPIRALPVPARRKGRSSLPASMMRSAERLT